MTSWKNTYLLDSKFAVFVHQCSIGVLSVCEPFDESILLSKYLIGNHFVVLEERVTLPPPPQVVYVPVPVRNNRRAGAKGMRGRGVQRSPGQRNNVRGVLNNTNFKTRFGAGAGRGGRAGLGRGGARRAPQGHYTPLPKKTVSQLDRELEEYMRKSKHPKIVV
ncbi:hypothetical protein ANCCEY_04262 [Ancylostoma ceylanicum]|uniref:Chromatin target of PRMT1 protein C-terminal domain-containing protein n=1 Tax=Ancylostoma ceylanicum TaxID=53326 RepID=A0A0D6M9U5_9BILA|nr:hypothetical protein ANCCEY_04262 [Ancylostoma ceylanicum]